VYNTRHVLQNRVLQSVMVYQHLEGTLVLVMCECDLHVREVKRSAISVYQGVSGPDDELEHRLWIYEPTNKPRTSHPIYMDMSTRHPFHIRHREDSKNHSGLKLSNFHMETSAGK
jgi:hypothetical protein